MKVIITGGTGLIGQALAQNLARDGHTAVLLSRRGALSGSLPAGARVVRWDGKSAAEWGEHADGADAIVNLAGSNLSAGRWTPRRKQEIIASRVDAGAAVVEAIRQARVKPKVLVQISGVGAYGTSETALFSEDAPYGSDFLAGVTQAWEASTAAVEKLGVRRVVARCGVVLARDAGAFPRLRLPFRFFAGGPLGSGRQWVSWLHLQDTARALRFLIETPAAQGIFNLAARPLTNHQLAQALGQAMHRPAFIPVPAFAVRLLFGEMSTLVLDGQRVASDRLQRLGFTYRYPEIDAALRELLN